MEITTDQISRIEKILLPDGASFSDSDNERIDVIQSLETIDINACPGSGKTTTLLAKLLILAEQMPLDDGSGIRVLAHTNVAIDEIKKSLSGGVASLFNYPNHFGTFQSFVNKYLGIPALIHFYGTRQSSIDVEIYETVLINQYYNSPKKNPFSSYIYAQNLGDYKSGELSYYQLEEIKRARLIKLRLDFIEEKISEYIFSDEAPPKSRLNFSSKTGKFVLKLKEELFTKGNLHYDDIYSLSYRYLNKFEEKIRKAFSKRFRYVFIDEMQDTYLHQKEIIEGVFDNSVVIQHFGDPHQAIYSYVRVQNVWEPKDEALPITGSKRFGENIAKILRTVCIASNENLKGNDKVDSFPPYIIVYDDDTVTQVLPRFVRLIKELGLDDISKEIKRPIKAVGWVGPDPDKPEKHTIKSFFQEYDRIANQKKSILPSLKSHLRKYNSSKAKDFSDSIINAFLRILELAEIKRETEKGLRSFTKNTLFNELWEQDESFLNQFKEKIATWIHGISQSSQDYDSEVLKSIRSYLEEEFLPYFEIEFQGELKKFVESNLISEAFDEEELSSKNVFYHNNEELKDIEVEVGTIHSVKGETHTATLYLETYYQGSRESDKIMNQLCGIPYTPPKSKKDTYTKETLKMAYVGMSRPTHFLCLAAKKENVELNKDALEKNGWIIDNKLITDE